MLGLTVYFYLNQEFLPHGWYLMWYCFINGSSSQLCELYGNYNLRIRMLKGGYVYIETIIVSTFYLILGGFMEMILSPDYTCTCIVY